MKQAAVSRPPVDPIVKRAESRWISTLEGQAAHTVTLALQVDRPTPLHIDVPPDQRLVSVKLNGRPLDIDVSARAADIIAGPASLGGSDEVRDALASAAG